MFTILEEDNFDTIIDGMKEEVRKREEAARTERIRVADVAQFARLIERASTQEKEEKWNELKQSLQKLRIMIQMRPELVDKHVSFCIRFGLVKDNSQFYYKLGQEISDLIGEASGLDNNYKTDEALALLPQIEQKIAEHPLVDDDRFLGYNRRQLINLRNIEWSRKNVSNFTLPSSISS